MRGALNRPNMLQHLPFYFSIRCFSLTNNRLREEAREMSNVEFDSCREYWRSGTKTGLTVIPNCDAIRIIRWCRKRHRQPKTTKEEAQKEIAFIVDLSRALSPAAHFLLVGIERKAKNGEWKSDATKTDEQRNCVQVRSGNTEKSNNKMMPKETE